MMKQMDYVKKYVDKRHTKYTTFDELAKYIENAKQDFDILNNLEEVCGFSIGCIDYGYLLNDLNEVRNMSPEQIAEAVEDLIEDYHKEIL